MAIRIVAVNTVKPDQIDRFKELTKPLIQASQAEEGCMEYDLYQDLNQPNVLTFLETWTDQEAIDLHGKTEHFTSIVPKLGDLCEDEGDVRLYKLL